MRHLHLDLMGGIAGDMFAAAMLDAFPTLGEGLVEKLRSAGLAPDVRVGVERVDGEVLAGSRFVVDDPRERGPQRPPHHAILAPTFAKHAGHGGHAHVPYADIRARIAASGLDERVIARAQDIFLHLAKAEAAVHGFADVDAVIFHEVGAQDSVADIVAAAILIVGCGASSWSVGPAPIGSGKVDTAHGLLPIPTPATRVLLEGFPVVDDGRPGERITPTGAAILRSLFPNGPTARRPTGALGVAGTGWGTKRFIGLPNVVRVLEVVVASAGASGTRALERDRVSLLSFDIDDQPAEDLAVGLENVRMLSGVLDVSQGALFGKKGRMATAVRVLCRLDVEDDVVRACLTETTTLGVRVERVERVVLSRESGTRDDVRIKSALRPGGTTTVKAEMDDIARVTGGADARRRARSRAEDA